MRPVEAITTVELFPGLSAALLSLLRSLSPEDWERPTVCASWSVKDVVAHLLDINIRKLSYGRDRLAQRKSDAPITSNEDLIDHINRQNAEWVAVAQRIGPKLLVEFLELTDREVYEFFKTLAPDGPARTAVAWAGDSQSPNWFDIAREYTEHWLHQQHIRNAVGQPAMTTRRWLYPVLDTFMRALPYTYRALAAPDGASISFHIEGEAGGDWTLLRKDEAWQLLSGSGPDAIAAVRVDQDTAWRLFTKGLDSDVALQNITLEGDRSLGAQVVHMVSIMA